MEDFKGYELEERFGRFERAAAKGHEESIWITSVVKDVEMEESALIEAFAQTEEPLGWYLAGKLSFGREAVFDFYKKSAEGGCSWGRVGYEWGIRIGYFEERDEKAYVEWIVKAANQNNPWAMELLGGRFRRRGGNDKEKAMSFNCVAAEMGWKKSMSALAEMLRDGKGCEKDLRQAAIWSAKGGSDMFWELLIDAKGALESGATEKLDCDFNQLCYSLGWGLYWYHYNTWRWESQSDNDAFSNPCLEYYCSCVELQQKSIFTFLLCWNRTTGVKGPGQMIVSLSTPFN
jgi:hypothetical protein